MNDIILPIAIVAISNQIEKEIDMSESNGVIDINDQNFDQVISDGVTIVDF